MSKLLRHIEETNKAFLNEIINAIKDDNDWLINLGISESELNNNIFITTCTLMKQMYFKSLVSILIHPAVVGTFLSRDKIGTGILA